MRLFSYVVRYDSGFAPNPFYGFCTLATCKPDIRNAAEIGHWVVGTGSADRKNQRGGHLVYAMRVTETLTFSQYWSDPRFQSKKPYLRGSRKQTCGDNIYRPKRGGGWEQLHSFHTESDGTPVLRHINKDTGVDRILVSNDFVYFGGTGPTIPRRLRNHSGVDLCKAGQGRKIFEDPRMIRDFESWIASLGKNGYAGEPLEWIMSPWR